MGVGTGSAMANWRMALGMKIPGRAKNQSWRMPATTAKRNAMANLFTNVYSQSPDPSNRVRGRLKRLQILDECLFLFVAQTGAIFVSRVAVPRHCRIER